jgi:hypothetical protein
MDIALRTDVNHHDLHKLPADQINPRFQEKMKNWISQALPRIMKSNLSVTSVTKGSDGKTMKQVVEVHGKYDEIIQTFLNVVADNQLNEGMFLPPLQHPNPFLFQLP